MDRPVTANFWSCSCVKNGSAWSAEQPSRKTTFLAAAFLQRKIKLKLILLLRFVHMDTLCLGVRHTHTHSHTHTKAPRCRCSNRSREAQRAAARLQRGGLAKYGLFLRSKSVCTWGPFTFPSLLLFYRPPLKLASWPCHHLLPRVQHLAAVLSSSNGLSWGMRVFPCAHSLH